MNPTGGASRLSCVQKLKEHKNVFVGGAIALAVLIMLGVAVAGYVVFFNHPKTNASAAAADTNATDTVTESTTSAIVTTSTNGAVIGSRIAEFLYFESAGDIERITVSDDASEMYTVISLTAEATIVQNVNNTIQIAASPMYALTVIGTAHTISVTVVGGNVTAIVEIEERVLNLTRAKHSATYNRKDFNGVPMRIVADDNNSPTVLINRTHIVITSPQVNVTTSYDVPTLRRSRPDSKQITVTIASGATAFERRAADDVRMTATAEKDGGVRLEASFTPKNLSLTVSASNGDSLHFTAKKTVAIVTNGMRLNAALAGDRYARIAAGGETVNVTSTDSEFRTITVAKGAEGIAFGAENASVAIVNAFGTLKRNGRNVTVVDAHNGGRITVDLESANAFMDDKGAMFYNATKFDATRRANYWVGSVGSVELTADASTILTKVGVLTSRGNLLNVLTPRAHIYREREGGEVFAHTGVGYLRLNADEVRYLHAINDGDDIDNASVFDTYVNIDELITASEHEMRAMLMTANKFRAVAPHFVVDVSDTTWRMGGAWGTLDISPI